MNISPNVKIMTADEYAASGDAAFKRGVEYGKLAERGAAARKVEPVELTMRYNFEFAKPAKPQVELFCWGPQREAIAAALPGVRLRPVFSAEQMLGLKPGVWVLCDEHSAPITSLIWNQIARDGWTTVYINTCYARAKARSR